MPWTRENLWCTRCRRETAHFQKPPAHPVHLFLSLITLGIWIIPWIWLSLKQDRPRCAVCGSYYSGPADEDRLDDWSE